MSLIDDYKTNCVLLDKKRQPDGEGGFLPAVWVDGASFKAAITFNSSMEARAAEKQGVTSRYTITAPLNAKLEYHDVIRRLRDDKVFRIKSDGDDVQTPKSATFQFLQVEAEEWELPV